MDKYGVSAADVVEQMRKLGMTVTEQDVEDHWDDYWHLAELFNQGHGYPARPDASRDAVPKPPRVNE